MARSRLSQCRGKDNANKVIKNERETQYKRRNSLKMQGEDDITFANEMLGLLLNLSRRIFKSNFPARYVRPHRYKNNFRCYIGAAEVRSKIIEGGNRE